MEGWDYPSDTEKTLGLGRVIAGKERRDLQTTFSKPGVCFLVYKVLTTPWRCTQGSVNERRKDLKLWSRNSGFPFPIRSSVRRGSRHGALQTAPQTEGK